MKKVLVIYNPVSGHHYNKNCEKAIKKILAEEEYEYIWQETKATKRQDFSIIKKDNFDRIIVAGGDGTISELASYCIKEKISIPLVIIAKGSANLLCIALGLPLFDVKKSLKIGLNNPGKKVDAMLINGKYHGLIAAGTGFDTAIMTGTSRWLKNRFGFIAYIFASFKLFFTYRSHEFKIEIDGAKEVINCKTLMVFNFIPFHTNFFLRKKTKSLIKGDDGKLNILGLNFLSTQNYEASEIKFTNNQKDSFQVDGDVYYEKLNSICVIPKAIQIVYLKDFK